MYTRSPRRNEYLKSRESNKNGVTMKMAVISSLGLLSFFGYNSLDQFANNKANTVTALEANYLKISDKTSYVKDDVIKYRFGEDEKGKYLDIDLDQYFNAQRLNAQNKPADYYNSPEYIRLKLQLSNPNIVVDTQATNQTNRIFAYNLAEDILDKNNIYSITLSDYENVQNYKIYLKYDVSFRPKKDNLLKTDVDLNYDLTVNCWVNTSETIEKTKTLDEILSDNKTNVDQLYQKSTQNYSPMTFEQIPDCKPKLTGNVKGVLEY